MITVNIYNLDDLFSKCMPDMIMNEFMGLVSCYYFRSPVIHTLQLITINMNPDGNGRFKYYEMSEECWNVPLYFFLPPSVKKPRFLDSLFSPVMAGSVEALAGEPSAPPSGKFRRGIHMFISPCKQIAGFSANGWEKNKINK